LSGIDVGEEEKDPLPCQAPNTEPSWLVKAGIWSWGEEKFKFDVKVKNGLY
jgi:hypothetical protein